MIIEEIGLIAALALALGISNTIWLLILAKDIFTKKYHCEGFKWLMYWNNRAKDMWDE